MGNFKLTVGKQLMDADGRDWKILDVELDMDFGKGDRPTLVTLKLLGSDLDVQKKVYAEELPGNFTPSNWIPSKSESVILSYNDLSCEGFSVLNGALKRMGLFFDCEELPGGEYNRIIIEK